MADIDIQEGSNHKKIGVKKVKKLSTRIDMTPMVDLVFLLITFFIFTTTMSQSTSMDLFLPKNTQNEQEETKVKNSGAFTILLGKSDQIYYYEGMYPLAMKTTNFKKIRDLVIDKKMRTPSKKLIIIIKPTIDATYKNMVDIIDEMTINQIERYAMLDITPQEYELVQKIQISNNIQ
ncbi:MAG: ExbD/TolR family protein [Flavobacteriales bacterium AspAUS03]